MRNISSVHNFVVQCRYNAQSITTKDENAFHNIAHSYTTLKAKRRRRKRQDGKKKKRRKNEIYERCIIKRKHEKRRENST